MLVGKRLVFGAALGAIVLAVTMVGIEFLSSLFAPPWPARAMNPNEPARARVLSIPFERQPWLGEPDNSWGMRDRERTFAKAAEIFRAVFVGDSFVESRFTPLSLPAEVQSRLDPSETRFEAVNLGVSASDPRDYYFRIRDVALEMKPDALLLFIYSANDFMPPGMDYSMWPRLIDQSPGGSILGRVMPRTNWLLVNRLKLASFFNTRKAPPNEDVMLYHIITAPKGERLGRLVAYVRTYLDPALSDEQVAEILSRGNHRYLDIALPNQGEQEYLLDWMLRIMINWEGGAIFPPRNAEEIKQFANKANVDATLSWIKATQRLAQEHGVPLLLFLAPVGSVDPDYVSFWTPWPLTFMWNRICQEWHSQLVAALSSDGTHFVDLTESLANVPGTYRKLDGHWSQKGLAIVADRVATELAKVMKAPGLN